MVAKPKPTKADRPKKRKNHKRGICPQCGYIWQTTPEHYPHCPKELDQIAFIKPKTEKQMREYACDELCRLITIWRDGCTCVINNSKCGHVSQWGHVIPQNSSSILVYELSNSFRQCDKHNILHRFVQAPYYDWYKATWGNLAYKMLVHEWESNVGNHLNAEDLHNRLIELSDLYDMRYSFGSASLEDKIEAGFYGTIIRDAWIKEGRI